MSSTTSTIITGPARSGTYWVARTMADMGIDAWHEGAFRPATLPVWDRLPETRTVRRLIDTKGRFHEVEVSWLAAPYLVTHIDASVPVIHLVRDPLATVKSLTGRLFNPERGGFNEYTEVARKHMGDVSKLVQEIDMCLHYWWCWNRMIEARAQKRFTLEDLSDGTDAWAELLDYLNLRRDHLHHIERERERNAGTGGKADVQWTDFKLPWVNEVQAMAQRYGYGG